MNNSRSHSSRQSPKSSYGVEGGEHKGEPLSTSLHCMKKQEPDRGIAHTHQKDGQELGDEVYQQNLAEPFICSGTRGKALGEVVLFCFGRVESGVRLTPVVRRSRPRGAALPTLAVQAGQVHDSFVCFLSFGLFSLVSCLLLEFLKS